ncbi:unnamed protein product [Thelazia callipaeda]|uniref:DUF3707 domain-containing protein n=1 Tax=Thelazia callipaeda TaxID=103827 RepID=A0A0N5D001_THECL|nr:unnamed protein product [Thelazia callipaeda]
MSKKCQNCLNFFLAFFLFTLIAPENGQNPSLLPVTCRNYGKVLLRGELDDCDPENFRCYLKNPIIINVTELICIVDDAKPPSKPPLVSCLVTENVPLMKEKCAEEGDCHSITLSCPVMNSIGNEITSDNDVLEQDRNIIAEQAIHPAQLLTIHSQDDYFGACFYFSNNNDTIALDENTRSAKSCTPVDAVCRMVEMTTVGKSTVTCTVQKSGKLHECLLIWQTNRQPCRESNCLSLHLNCPILDEYEMILPIQKSKSGKSLIL